jgi:hypothetical protein
MRRVVRHSLATQRTAIMIVRALLFIFVLSIGIVVQIVDFDVRLGHQRFGVLYPFCVNGHLFWRRLLDCSAQV